MNNWMRLGIAAGISLILTVVAYMLPFDFMLYFFAPGFWLGDILPTGLVNALGGERFPIFASPLIWTLLIFVLLLLIRRTKRRGYR